MLDESVQFASIALIDLGNHRAISNRAHTFRRDLRLNVVEIFLILIYAAPKPVNGSRQAVFQGYVRLPV